MCHLLLGLPFLALPLFWLLPLELAAPAYAAAALIALGIYAYALKAMRMPRVNGAEGMLGETGRVVGVGERGATLFFHGELWSADVEGELPAAGDAARIVGIEGLRLRIKRCGKPICDWRAGS